MLPEVAVLAEDAVADPTTTTTEGGDDHYAVVVPTHLLWTSVPERYATERRYFDFERLSFSTRRPKALDAGSEGHSASHKAGAPTETTANSSFLSTSDDFSNRLELQPSQRVSQHLMRVSTSSSTTTAPGSTRKKSLLMNSSGNSGRRMSSNEELRLDKLAFEDLTVVGREAEILALQELYHQAASTAPPQAHKKKKMAVVVGPSGTGKSILAQQLKERLLKRTTNANANSFIWCSGKFDQQNQADPYEAITAAITSLIQTAPPHLIHEWRNVIGKTLGEESQILVELVPAVSILLQPEKPDPNDPAIIQDTASSNDERTPFGKPKKPTSPSSASDRSITERAMRIQNVLVEFLRLVSTEQHPVTLLLDDIQWAGSAALGLLDVLLIDQTLNHFFLLTTCRQEYLPPQQEAQAKDQAQAQDATTTSATTPLQQLLEKHSPRIHQLVIHGIDATAVQRLINTLLRMDADEPKTTVLAQIVHHKTDGNPFFVLQFMSLLCQEGLLTYEWANMSWSWIEGDIQSQNVATNVADAVQKRLQTLQRQDLVLLQVASCIGNSFELSMLHFVMEGLLRSTKFQKEWSTTTDREQDDRNWPRHPTEFKVRLDSLVAMGILESQFVHGKYDFAHDQIQAAAFRLIPDETRVPLQTAIGKRLIEGLDDNHRDQFLFTAVQLRSTAFSSSNTRNDGDRENNKDDKKHFAFWAFLAGDTALKQGAFEAALGYFDIAALCLGDKPFEEDTELALPLFCGAAEAAYSVGNERVQEFVDLVHRQKHIERAKMMRVSLIELKVLSGKRDFHGCAEAFRKIVRELGVTNFQKNPSVLRVLFQVGKTAKLLKKYDRKKFLQLPQCTNPNVKGALSAETASFYQLYLSNANLCTIATCMAIQWSIGHGHSKATPSAMASMAMMIVGISGDYASAIEIGETALELCDVYGYKEALPQTVGLVFGFVRHWAKPMHDFLTPMRYAIDIGMRLGCMDDVAFLVNTFGLLLVLTQIDTLPSAIKEIEGFRYTMEELKHRDHLSFTECNLQFAHKMAFLNDDYYSLNGEVMQEQEMLTLAEGNNDVILTAFVYYYKMMLNVYYGRPIDAAEAGKNNIDFGFTYCQGAHMIPRNTFFIGLSMVLAYRFDGKKKRLQTAKVMKKRLKTWVKSSNPNVLHFLHLLQAELEYAKNEYNTARDDYVAAIKTSMRTGFKLDYALSNELLALFYCDSKNPLHDMSQARYHMEAALESYKAYGAANKVRHMTLKYKDLV